LHFGPFLELPMQKRMRLLLYDAKVGFSPTNEVCVCVYFLKNTKE